MNSCKKTAREGEEEEEKRDIVIMDGVLVMVWILLFILLLWLVFGWKPQSCRSKFRKQGISGPPQAIVVGNTYQMLNIISQTWNPFETQNINCDCYSVAFPSFKQWQTIYGHMYTFALGSLQFLCVTSHEMVGELKLFRSLDLGKPSYLQKERGSLLGKGLITSNGLVWSHQRRLLGPHLYKVKDKWSMIVESGDVLVKSWESLMDEAQVGIVDMRVDDHMRSFTSRIISKMVFGHDHRQAMNLFPKLQHLIKATGSASSLGVPFLRFMPTKGNREMWRLEKEVQSLVMEIVRGRNGSTDKHQDMLEVILEGSRSEEKGDMTSEEFVVRNCKDVILAAFEVNAIAATWGLMLLASHPHWQECARAEVLEVCSGQPPTYDMLAKMKVLKMVIYEVLRLYPAVVLTSRQALKDVKIGGVSIPKDANIWVMTLALHRDPDLWGPDAHKFNPERFKDGVSNACKSPNGYIPFGFGARVCPGQTLAIAEFTVLFAMILSNFDLSLSPSYRHSPTVGLLLQPEHGVHLIVQKRGVEPHKDV